MNAVPAIGEPLPDLAVDVTASTVAAGATAARVWQPVHHDRAYAVGHYGAPDIFLATPTVTAWLERYLTDWTGPSGRVGRLGFRMRRPIHAGDRIVISGTVVDREIDDAGVCWADVDLVVAGTDASTGEVHHSCTGRARVAVPATTDDNPWTRAGDDWRP